MAIGATEALQLIMHWDGARLQWAVGQNGVCLSAGEEMAEGSEHAVAAIAELRRKGLNGDEVVWSNRHAHAVLVPETLNGETAFALEHGVTGAPLRHDLTDRLGDALACWELRHPAVEQAVMKAWPGVRLVNGTLVYLEALKRREQGVQDHAVYLDVSPCRSFWTHWNAGQLMACMATDEVLPENVLYQIANSLHRDGTAASEARLYFSGETEGVFLELLGRFFKEVSPMKPFYSWDVSELDLKSARWCALWNLIGCAS